MYGCMVVTGLCLSALLCPVSLPDTVYQLHESVTSIPGQIIICKTALGIQKVQACTQFYLSIKSTNYINNSSGQQTLKGWNFFVFLGSLHQWMSHTTTESLKTITSHRIAMCLLDGKSRFYLWSAFVFKCMD